MMRHSLPSEYLPEPDEETGLQLPAIDNADDLLADQELSEPPELVKGVLHRGLKGVIGGSSKARKTWTLLALAVAVAAGREWMGFPCTQGKVLFINFEIPRPFMRSRIQAVKQQFGLESVAQLEVWTLRGHARALEVLRSELIEKILQGEYALVIIDPIYKCYGGKDENKASDIGELCNELERIAEETGAAVVYAAHYSKGNQAGKESIDRISGSGVFTRDADTIINFTKHSEENCYTVDMILRNCPEQPAFVVEWRYPTMMRRDDLDPALLKEVKPRKKEQADVTALNVLAHVPLGKGEYITKDVLVEKCRRIPLSEKRTMAFVRLLLGERQMYQWNIPRSGTRPEVAYARAAQPNQNEWRSLST